MAADNATAGVIDVRRDGHATDRVRVHLERVIAGKRPGERLPSVRELMRELRAGPVTIQRAIAELVARGAIEARPGRGTFVAAPPRPPIEPPDTAWQAVALGPTPFATGALGEVLRPPPAGAIALSGGYLPSDLQPAAALAASLARAARKPGAWDRVAVEGLDALRAWFARAIGGGLSTSDILIASGGQAALSACMRGLATRGGAICVEAPTYVGVLAAARAAGLRIVPVPTDRLGVRPELLAQALERSQARLAYLQAVFANPTGVTLAAERRADVLAAVRAAGAFVIEDDAFRETALDGPAPPPPLIAQDPHGHVVHVRSLTKPAAPGLRVSALAARGLAFQRLLAARLTEDYFVPGPLQEAAVELLSAPGWPRHVKRMRNELRRRRDALCTAIERDLGLPVTKPHGGLHVWQPLEPGEDDVAVARAAAAQGVIVTAGTPWWPADVPGPYLRLTYALEEPERIAEGVRRLATARR